MCIRDSLRPAAAAGAAAVGAAAAASAAAAGAAAAALVAVVVVEAALDNCQLSTVICQLLMIKRHLTPVSYTHLRAHETPEHLVCRLLLEKKKKTNTAK